MIQQCFPLKIAAHGVIIGIAETVADTFRRF